MANPKIQPDITEDVLWQDSLIGALVQVGKTSRDQALTAY